MRNANQPWRWIIEVGLALLSPLVAAQTGGLSAVTVTTLPNGAQEYSLTLQILALMTALTFLPSILIMMTSFTRIIIVLSILRQAIGLQQSPSNQVLIGLSLFLTLFIMTPVYFMVPEQEQPAKLPNVLLRNSVWTASMYTISLQWI